MGVDGTAHSTGNSNLSEQEIIGVATALTLFMLLVILLGHCINKLMAGKRKVREEEEVEEELNQQDEVTNDEYLDAEAITPTVAAISTIPFQQTMPIDNNEDIETGSLHSVVSTVTMSDILISFDDPQNHPPPSAQILEL